LLDREDAARVPSVLVERWRTPSAFTNPRFPQRLDRFRRVVIPWLHATRPLIDTTILEIGSGYGASTYALAEQGARVTGVDIDPSGLADADRVLRAADLHADLHCSNAIDLAEIGAGTRYDSVIFWACLEHMTVPERIVALRDAWKLLPIGGHLTLIETPNRLWPQDSHTSLLPFFSWLPDDLALSYAQFSPREGFPDRLVDADEEMLQFLRRGRGVSFHEFDLAIADGSEIEMRSCMQLERRQRNLVRRIGWSVSAAGRTERALQGFAPDRHRAWFQPFLYLTLERTAGALVGEPPRACDDTGP
jgi:S-adenosylmethionine-dependent methyltransferase